METPRFVTVVVGAGPAGLLFCLSAALRSGADRLRTSPIILVDKRTTYERSHRLRMDKRPYLAAQQSINHPLFDELIEFLRTEDFRPAANKLETKLAELVREVGITRQVLRVGPGEDAVDLGTLRKSLEDQGVLASDGQLMVVAADSVNSETRKMVTDSSGAVEKVHQTVARLHVRAEGLPKSLDLVRQFKLSKLLGSAIDYRANPNGYAEIDLFLSSEEHAVVEAMGARAAEPVLLTNAILEQLDAPLFASVVSHVSNNLNDSAAIVSIQSTFRLEHRYQNQVGYLPSENTGVFLVGDAAVSLPFFRGMACLMECADALGALHADLLKGPQTASQLASARDSYDSFVAATRNREIKTVETRARTVSIAREIVRVSSMAPFPLQTWLLSFRRPSQSPTKVTPMLIGTVLLLVLAATFAASSPVIGLAGLLCVPLQAAAGALYRSDLAHPGSSNPAVAMVCRYQMLALTSAGAAVLFLNPFDSGWFIRAGAAIGWWVLGLVFVTGMYAFERLGQKPQVVTSSA